MPSLFKWCRKCLYASKKALNWSHPFYFKHNCIIHISICVVYKSNLYRLLATMRYAAIHLKNLYLHMVLEKNVI